MIWLSLAAALAELVLLVLRQSAKKGEIDQAAAAIAASRIKGEFDELKRANAARDSVRTADPDELRKPDPFQRPDF